MSYDEKAGGFETAKNEGMTKSATSFGGEIGANSLDRPRR
jgi:hypothetical protein